MTAHEALWLIKTQLAKTTQNIEAVKVLERLVKEHYRLPLRTPPQMSLDEAIIELGLGNELDHIKNHMAKVGKKDIEEFSKALIGFAEFSEEDDD
jgi:hypothetical protein